MLVSAIQKNESAIGMHISPVFWIPLPFRWPQSAEWGFLCYTVGSHCACVQSCLTLCDSMDCSPLGSSVQARKLEWVVILFSWGSSGLGIEPRSPALQADSLPSEPPEKPLMISLLIYFIHGINSMYILIPTSQFFPHDSCSWGMRIFHLTGITVKWFYMTVIDFLIVFVRPILLGTSAVLGFFLNIYTQAKMNRSGPLFAVNIPSWVLKGNGEEGRKNRSRFKYASIKTGFSLHFESLKGNWKVIETRFTRIGCLESFLCKVKWSEVTQLCPTLCNPMDCSLPGSSVHGIFQAIVLEWIAISLSRGSSWPRDRTQVSRIVDRRLTVWAPGKESCNFLSSCSVLAPHSMCSVPSGFPPSPFENS